jgi:hypothetical protein
VLSALHAHWLPTYSPNLPGKYETFQSSIVISTPVQTFIERKRSLPCQTSTPTKWRALPCGLPILQSASAVNEPPGILSAQAENRPISLLALRPLFDPRRHPDNATASKHSHPNPVATPNKRGPRRRVVSSFCTLNPSSIHSQSILPTHVNQSPSVGWLASTLP